MSITDVFFGTGAAHDDAASDERPVKMVQESANVWRVVYAD